jgi:ankyrin repeat protein
MSSEQRLYEAIERKDYQKCKRLIEAESDILNKQCNQKYPLFVACGNNQFELVELFLKVKIQSF